MFSDVLDTVRKADLNNFTSIESYLMRTALSGQAAVLSPNQAIDSSAIHALVDGNADGHGNHFTEAVSSGILRISLPPGTRDLIDYMLLMLNRGSQDRNAEFRFSSLGFLYEKDADDRDIYSYEERAAVLRYIQERIVNSKSAWFRAEKPSLLRPETEIPVERLIGSILRLNESSSAYSPFVSRQDQLPRTLTDKLTSRLGMEDPETPLAELLRRTLEKSSAPDAPFYRTYYYRLVESDRRELGPDAVAEVKSIIDLSYNELMAQAVGQPSALTVGAAMPEVAAMQADTSPTDLIVTQAIQSPDQDTAILNWEYVTEIVREVRALCEAKHCSWEDGLRLYYQRQSRLPFLLGGKYFFITSVTMAVSAIPVIGAFTNNLVSEFLWNVVCDTGGVLLKKPSVSDLVKAARSAKGKTKLMDLTLFSSH